MQVKVGTIDIGFKSRGVGGGRVQVKRVPPAGGCRSKIHGQRWRQWCRLHVAEGDSRSKIYRNDGTGRRFTANVGIDGVGCRWRGGGGGQAKDLRPKVV